MEDLIKRLEARADNEYCRYISLLRRDECLGWEAKVDHGKFGLAEIEAHKAAQEALGKHRAFNEAAKMLREALKG